MNRWTDGQTDGQTDKVIYRGAYAPKNTKRDYVTGADFSQFGWQQFDE